MQFFWGGGNLIFLDKPHILEFLESLLTLSVNTLMMLSRCKIKGKSRSIMFRASRLNAVSEPRSSLYLKNERMNEFEMNE